MATINIYVPVDFCYRILVHICSINRSKTQAMRYI